MLLLSSGFVCICPPKSVELGTDSKLHRADHQSELHAELEFEVANESGSEYAYLPGGGVRAINPNSSMTLDETDTCIAVFKGNLTNKVQLALSLPTGSQHLTEAQLLIKLFAELGLDMLGRLDGQFAFCLYDSKQARVLAARDPSGAVPLVEGRTAAGSLIIACGTFMPEGVYDVVEIGPGQCKYGWHALPRSYNAGSGRQPPVRASLDYGIRRRSMDAYREAYRAPRQSLDSHQSRYSHPSQRRSLDHSHRGPTSARGTSSSNVPQGQLVGGAGRSSYVPPHIAAAHSAQQGADKGHQLQQQQQQGQRPHGHRGSSRRASLDKGHSLQQAVNAPAAAAAAQEGAGIIRQAEQLPQQQAGASAEKKTRRRRRRSHAAKQHTGGSSGSSQHADGGSDTESFASCSTHDSAHSSGVRKQQQQVPTAKPKQNQTGAAAAGGEGNKEAAAEAHGKDNHGQAASAAAGPVRGHSSIKPKAAAAGAADSGAKQHHSHQHHKGRKKTAATPAAAPAAAARPQPAAETTVVGFKRDSSCGDLAAAAGVGPVSSSSAAHFRSAALEGLAC